MTDEILTEIHAIKDANARKYRTGYAAMMRELRRRQAQSGHRVIPAPRSQTKGRRDRKVALPV